MGEILGTEMGGFLNLKFRKVNVSFKLEFLKELGEHGWLQ